MTTKPDDPSGKPSLYDRGNDAVRLDNFRELDEAVALAMRSFLRFPRAVHV